jgi:hypothetical protein
MYNYVSIKMKYNLNNKKMDTIFSNVLGWKLLGNTLGSNNKICPKVCVETFLI